MALMRTTFLASGLRAALYLCGLAPAVFVIIALSLNRLPGHGAWADVAGTALAVGSLALGAALWARWLARTMGWPHAGRLMTAAAVTYCLAVFADVVALGQLEGVFVERRLAGPVPVHIVFAFLFTPAAGLVCALLALVIGRNVGGWRPALRLAAWSGLAAGGAFLLADIIQDLLGRRVGGLRAEETLTMLSVAFIGNIFAAFAGGGVIGARLMAKRQASPAASASPAVQELPTT